MEGGKTDTIFVMRIKKKKWRREMDRLNLYYFIDTITLLSDGVDFCCNPHDLFITKQHLNNLKKVTIQRLGMAGFQASNKA